jgi:hypothetical protein
MNPPIRVALALFLAACAGSDATAPPVAPEGSLTITVTGPPGVRPAIVVTGPGGYSVSVTGSLTLAGLRDGTYAITASKVVVSGSTYAPAVPFLEVLVAAGDSGAVAVAIDYVVADGALGVAISGLPGSTLASVTITGPGGFSQVATESQVFKGLIAGSYTISAANVLVSGTSYEPTPPVTGADVAASAVSTGIRILYALPFPVAKVTLSPLQRTLALIPGMVTPPVRLVASVEDTSGTTRTGRVVTWASDDPAVATVDATGLVEAVGPGAAGITAASEGISARAAISVVSLSGPPAIAGTWLFSVTASTGSTCHGSGTIAVSQPADSGYSPATVSLRGGCSRTSTLRSYSYSFSGTVAFRVALDGTSFGFTAGDCRFFGQITDIFGASPSKMSGGGRCPSGGPGVTFTWSATKQ